MNQAQLHIFELRVDQILLKFYEKPPLQSGGLYMDEEKTNRLKVMRFWLVGTFAIVSIAITAYIGFFTSSDWVEAIKAGFPIWGITAAACILWYLGYLVWLRRE
jgi:hypothetical protein